MFGRQKGKDLAKPWGKRESYTVLVFLFATILISAILAAASRNWKLPGLPSLLVPKFSKINLDFLSGETITIGPGKREVDPALIAKADKIKEEFTKRTKNLSGTYALDVI